MLNSTDPELKNLAMDIVYMSREKRIKLKEDGKIL